jgi:hypothetical protein
VKTTALPLDYVPDAVWPTDNEWGVPSLLFQRQSDSLILPVTRWGSLRRGRKVGGTIHFYTDDYKFSGLWRRPDKVLAVRPEAIIEPNFSTDDAMPPAAALWAIFRKRWLSRYWQSRGANIIVDLAVAPRHRSLALLGVPAGWRAYSTTANTAEDWESCIEAEHAIAVQHAGRPVLFVVYGGGRKAEQMAMERGWVWLYRREVGQDGA